MRVDHVFLAITIISYASAIAVCVDVIWPAWLQRIYLLSARMAVWVGFALLLIPMLILDRLLRLYTEHQKMRSTQREPPKALAPSVYRSPTRNEVEGWLKRKAAQRQHLPFVRKPLISQKVVIMMALLIAVLAFAFGYELGRHDHSW